MRNAFFANRSDDALWRYSFWSHSSARVSNASAGEDGVDKAEALRGLGVDRFAGEQELEAFARRELARELVRRDGREDAEVDLRLAEGRAVRGQDEVAGHRQLAAAAEGRAAHEGDGDELELREHAEAVVKDGEHRHDAVAEVILHARAGGEGLAAGCVDDQGMAVARDAPDRVAQLLEHGDVEDVQRRIAERDPVHMRVGGEGDLHRPRHRADRRRFVCGGAVPVQTSIE